MTRYAGRGVTASWRNRAPTGGDTLITLRASREARACDRPLLLRRNCTHAKSGAPFPCAVVSLVTSGVHARRTSGQKSCRESRVARCGRECQTKRDFARSKLRRGISSGFNHSSEIAPNREFPPGGSSQGQNRMEFYVKVRSTRAATRRRRNVRANAADSDDSARMRAMRKIPISDLESRPSVAAAFRPKLGHELSRWNALSLALTARFR